MQPASDEEARRLLEFIDASPSPYHACRRAASALESAGFARQDESAPWAATDGGAYVLRGGSLVAWWSRRDTPPERGFRLIGAHTDSPNLRVKPRPDTGRAGYRQLALDVYGGVLLNSWLDRDLGLSGRLYLRGERGPEERLFRIDRPVLRIPQLAIHLDREVNEKGLVLNKQVHLTPVWGLARTDERGFRRLLGDELDLEPERILSWDAMCHDVQPSRLVGWNAELISAPRLDNLCSAHCGLAALLAVSTRGAALDYIPVLALFDHEEVGSDSRAGAGSPLLGTVLERSLLARGGAREDLHRAVAASVCVSADMAHATHPNYSERHEPGHTLEPNAGPVIKINANQRYATEGETEALFEEACRHADVPVQKFVNRGDLGCGSTIGPITAAGLGLRTVDVGNPQLAMHSSRELAGAHDPAYLVAALTAFLREPRPRA